jgi:hypothetical protein
MDMGKNNNFNIFISINTFYRKFLEI